MNRNELTDDQVLRLVGISRVTLRGRKGGPATPKTVRKWIRRGYSPPGWAGEPLRLKAVLMGQEYCTLPEWAEEFELARARMGVVPDAPAGPPPVPARRAAAEDRRAAKELAGRLAKGPGGRRRQPA